MYHATLLCFAECHSAECHYVQSLGAKKIWRKNWQNWYETESLSISRKLQQRSRLFFPKDGGLASLLGRASYLPEYKRPKFLILLFYCFYYLTLLGNPVPLADSSSTLDVQCTHFLDIYDTTSGPEMYPVSPIDANNLHIFAIFVEIG
jgi:hypothetical protein